MTQHNPLSPPSPLQFSSSLHPVATGAGAGAMRALGSHQARVSVIITIRVGPVTASTPSATRFLFPSAAKVVRKFQEVVTRARADTRLGLSDGSDGSDGVRGDSHEYCSKLRHMSPT